MKRRFRTVRCGKPQQSMKRSPSLKRSRRRLPSSTFAYKTSRDCSLPNTWQTKKKKFRAWFSHRLHHRSRFSLRLTPVLSTHFSRNHSTLSHSQQQLKLRLTVSRRSRSLLLVKQHVTFRPRGDTTQPNSPNAKTQLRNWSLMAFQIPQLLKISTSHAQRFETI